MKDFFSHYVFKGTHYQVGCQYGEVLRELIRQHMDMIFDLSWNNSELQKEQVLELTQGYIPYIDQYAPGYFDEIRGIAKGANLTETEALLLQIRQEVVHSKKHSAPECTSYVIPGALTANGKAYSGQNIDLAGNFEAIANVITFAVDNKPRVIMVCPAGQMSHVGMNEHGLSCNCNYLTCNGWKKGFPRYMLSRLVLEQRSFEAACAKLESVKERAASRNVLIADETGRFADYEMLTDSYAKLPKSDFCVHSNHFLSKELLGYETNDPYEMEDSTRRYERLHELIQTNRGAITPKMIKTFLRDHGNGSELYTVCLHATEHNEYHSFASIINHLEDRVFEVAVGNPCQHEYASFEL